jgi:hypothetical protein
MKLADWLDGHLIDDWRKAYRLLSVQFGAVATVAAGVWMGLDDDKQAALLRWAHIDVRWALPIGFVLAIVLRLKRQAPKGGDQ